MRAQVRAWLLVSALLGQHASGGGPQSCPSACFCDAQFSVTCEGDTLWRLPDDIPTGVRRLELRSFIVPTLSATQLSAFSNLTELKAQRNSISSIENGTFSSLIQLEKLDLSQNQLSEVTAGTLASMSKMTNLDLSSNRLTSVEGAFAGMNSLEQLTLRSNNLTKLGPKTFSGLDKLQYLNIDSNKISEIDVSAFQPLQSLAHLILSNNPLSNLSRLEFFGSRLQYIDVSAVGLTAVPQSLTQYVRDLRLAKNNISILRQGDFDSYPYLGLLVLDDCGIRHVEEDTLGRHDHLMRLWLNGNFLQSVPASMPEGLKALYLEENQIRVLHRDEFQGLSNLEQLFMQRNLIDTVEDCAFCGLSSLKNLDLQANKIESISSSSFSGLIELQTLDLSQNPLAVLEPGSLTPLASLRSLQLSRIKNNITAPESLFDTLEKLEKLDMFDSAPLVTRVINSGRLIHGIRSVTQLNIMHNKLSRLRADLPQLLPKLQLLKLGGSWWNCSDPDILWLTDWMADGRVQFYSPFSARCRQPPRLMLKSVALLTDGDFEILPTRPPTVANTSDPVPQTTIFEDFDTHENTVAIATTTETPESTHPPLSSVAATFQSPTVSTTSQQTTTTTTSSTARKMPTSPKTTSMKSTATTELPTSMTITSPTATTVTTRTPSSTTTKINRLTTETRSTHTTGNSMSNILGPFTMSPRMLKSSHEDAVPSPGRVPIPIASSGQLDAYGQMGHVIPVMTTSARRNSMVAVFTSLAAAVGVLLLLLAAAIALWRYRRGAVHPFIRRRKGSSISYSHQKDEVNILEEECGASSTDSGSVGSGGDGDVFSPPAAGAVRDPPRAGAGGRTHHGLSNALYFLGQREEMERPRRPASLPTPAAAAGVDACPRAVADAWATPSPDAAHW